MTDTPASTDDSDAARTWTPEGAPTAIGVDRGPGGAGLLRGQQIGRYLILALIGSGGMGVVYAAHDPELDRKVALKLLRAGPEDQTIGRELRTRLLREAQALAQLAHPCVVTVHDVGTHGDRVWIAMEFIAGETLTSWLQRPRPWQEVVAVLRRAGEGLAAAHAAGLVHRDFKPDNVMVSADGRVRVMDFGLARAEQAPAPVDLRGSASALKMAVTTAGAVMGTPQYMAPEQWLGAATDARTDQFAFCVTLWEALYRQRPYGDTLGELALAVTGGQRRAPPRRSRVPSWLHAVLERGLASSADARWPDMDRLLAALAGGAGRRRRRLALAATLLIGLGLGGLVVSTRLAKTRQQQACAAAGASVRELWSEPRRDDLRAALLATRAPHAAMTFTHLAPIIDRFVDAWARAREDVCLRQLDTRELAPELAERGRDCLLEARWSLEALLVVLQEGDPGAVQPAVNAAARLPNPALCQDATLLAQRSQLPADEATRAEVTGVRRDLERARAATATGRYHEGAARARALVRRAGAIGWAPLLAQTQVLAGELTDRSGDSATGERLLEDGLHLAIEVGDDGVAADAATILADVVGDNLARFSEGLRWARLASGLVQRLGQGDGTRGAKLAAAIAGIHESRGDYVAAEPYAARALELWEQILGADNPSVALAINNLAIILSNLERSAEARVMFERALAVSERALGPTHPSVAAMLNNLGNSHLLVDEFDAAQPLFERALQIRETSLGADHPGMAIGLLNLAGVALARGDHDAAGRYNARALALLTRNDDDPPELATAVEHVALIHRARGELDEALSAERRSLQIRERRFGRDHPERALGLQNLGDIQRTRGELADAERSYDEALALAERVRGADDAAVVGPLRGLGEVALARHDPARARALLERAVEVGARTQVPARQLAEVQLTLAKALQASDPARARALAVRASAGVEGEDPAARAQRAEITAWLASVAAP